MRLALGSMSAHVSLGAFLPVSASPANHSSGADHTVERSPWCERGDSNPHDLSATGS